MPSETSGGRIRGRIKAYAAAGVSIGEKEKGVFVTLSDNEKPNFVEIVKRYVELGFSIYTTEGTGKYLKINGLNLRLKL